jgi:hypothetical protein
MPSISTVVEISHFPSFISGAEPAQANETVVHKITAADTKFLNMVATPFSEMTIAIAIV